MEVVVVAEVGDVLTTLRRGARELVDAAPEADAWPVAERRRALADIDGLIDLLTTARARLLVAEKRAETWRGRGDASFEAWRGRTSRQGRGRATREVRTAEQL